MNSLTTADDQTSTGSAAAAGSGATATSSATATGSGVTATSSATATGSGVTATVAGSEPLSSPVSDQVSVHPGREQGKKKIRPRVSTLNRFFSSPALSKALELEKIGLSPLVLALAILVTINAYLLHTQPLAKIDPEALPAARTWIWWATKEYLSTQPPPSVVLLGSSLLMHPVSRLDADYLNRDLDYVHHHRSQYLEDALSARMSNAAPTAVSAATPVDVQTNVPTEGVPLADASNVTRQPAVCFNFALPGGMVSDDYIVARALFSGKRKPKVVVLGLSLRDFIDSGVHCAGATPAFRYLKRFTNIDDLVDISMPQIWQRIDYWLGKYIYLWGKKLELQVWLSQITEQAFKPSTAKISVPSPLGNLDLERDLPVNLRSEVEEGQFIVKSHQPYSYDDNTAEYKKRYRSPNQSLFSIQTKFLQMLLQYCNHNNIKVIIVNMPVTPQNVALMPAGSYDQYLRTLQAASQQAHCKFLDLDAAVSTANFTGITNLGSITGSTGTTSTNSGNTANATTAPKFTRTDFYDTSHMNSSGGKKFADVLVQELSSR